MHRLYFLPCDHNGQRAELQRKTVIKALGLGVQKITRDSEKKEAHDGKKQQALIEEIIDKINHIKMYRRSKEVRQKGGRGTACVLSYLYYNGNRALPSELSKVMNVTTPRVTVILNELEKEGLITRSISSEDRRNVDVILSDEGRQIVGKKLERQRENILHLLERLDEGDAQAFLRILEATDDLISEQNWEL